MTTLGSMRPALTLIEILIVIMILAIAAMIVVPRIGTAADAQATGAARVLQADLEVARSLALTKQQSYSLVFSPDRQSYKVVANYAGGAYATAVAVDHPVIAGKLFEVTLARLNGMSSVTVTSVSFGGQTYVTFSSQGDPVAAGSVTIHAGSVVMVVAVEGLTGVVTATRTAG
jgi:prepilin-type N-terminal cleavage/methylation domain-containing protein